MENHNTRQYDDEIDLIDIAKNLFKQRGLIVAFALLFSLLGLAFQLSHVAFYKAKGVSYPIAIEFLTLKNGSYPNGTAFAFSDIIAPENLKDAIEKTKLNIDVKALAGAISITPSNSLIEVTEEKLLETLDAKKVTEAQLEETKKALAALRLESKTYGTLHLDLTDLKVSTSDAKKLLENVAISWAENALSKGLITPDIAYPEEPFIYDSKAVIIDNYDKLVNYAGHLQSAFSRLSALNASDTVIVDAQNLDDITRKVKVIIEKDIQVMRAYAYSIAPALIKDNPLLEVQIFSQRRVKELNKQELVKKIATYDEVLEQLNYNTPAGERTNLESPFALRQDRGAETTLDGGILNELLTLGSKVSSSELRKDIVNRRISTSEQLFAIEKEIAMLKGVESPSQLPENQQKIIASLPKIFEQTVNEINQLQKTFVSILSEYKQISLNKSKTLYSAVAAPYVVNPLGIPVKRTIIVLVAATMIGLFIGMVVALLRSAFLSSEKKAKVITPVNTEE